MKSFLDTLNYSSCNEDSRSEIEALQINSHSSILCITGSGARVLDLLIEKPKKIISIDFNPVQNFLLELKMAAIQNLEYEEFLKFIGISSSEKRTQVYKTLRSSLSSPARNFWDSHSSLMEKGVIYQGRWERYFAKLAHFLSMVRPKALAKVFGSHCIEEQIKIWNEKWDIPLWRIFLHSISSPKFWKYFLGDPGFYYYVPDQFSIYNYLLRKFNSASKNIMFNISPFTWLLFYGKYDLHTVLPLHLQKIHYKTLQNQLSGIQIVTQSLLEYLEQGKKNQFHKYSLSDFASYTSRKDYVRIWQGILETAIPGAIICERQFLVKRAIPAKIKPRIIQNTSLQKKLEKTDDSLFYTFNIVQVR